MSVQNETMQHLIAFNGFRGGQQGQRMLPAALGV